MTDDDDSSLGAGLPWRQHVARAHTESALSVLSGIMNEPGAPHSARVAAAQALLDRGWGKAPQSLEITGEVKHSVIRAPAIAETSTAWAAEHVPEQHRTEH